MYFARAEWKNRVALCRLWQSEEPRLQFNFCLKIIFFFPEFLYILFVFNMSRSVSMTIYEMTCSINSVSICVYDIENTGPNVRWILCTIFLLLIQLRLCNICWRRFWCTSISKLYLYHSHRKAPHQHSKDTYTLFVFVRARYKGTMFV